MGKDTAQDKAWEYGRENLIGKVCTWTFKNSEAARNRCKAADKLYNAAKNAVAAVPTCTAAVVADGATVGSGGLASPAGLLTTGQCLGNVVGAGDNLQAGLRQLATGKDTPTYTDQAKDYLLDKAKEGGAWVKEKVKKWVDDTAYEIETSGYRHAKEADPDLTPDAYNRGLDAQDRLFE